MEEDIVVVLCTAPPGDAERIADLVVGKNHAACVSIFGVGSIYRWEGKIRREREELMIVKTDRDHLNDLIETMKGAHPYEVPEIVALPVIAGNRDYLAWVREAVRGRPSP